MASGPLLFGALITLGVMLGFVAIWTTVNARDPVEARMEQYGVTAELAGGQAAGGKRRRGWPGVNRLLNGFGLGPKLALALMRAGIPLTAAEYALIVVGLAGLGLLLGLLRGAALIGLLLAALLGSLPIAYLRIRQGQRLRDFTLQLPDMLTLLIGALRAGHGLTQALDMIANQVPEPASTEIGRVMRGVGLGLPIQRALSDMADRLGSDDFDLVVTALTVQYETGGDLAQTLETIAETVRDRIRIKRDIRTFTAQQRFTGYVLALLPLGLGVAIYMLNPVYMSKLFLPSIRMVPVAAVLLQLIGFLIIRKIVDIEV